jgi:hypothetical protein
MPRPAAVVCDEQILSLVAAADGLSRRQRQRSADGSPSAADERLLRLDWAVRAGRLVLADRAARGLMSTEGTAQPWRGQL